MSIFKQYGSNGLFLMTDKFTSQLNTKGKQYQREKKIKVSGSDGRESACKAGDLGSIPGSGRSPGEGNGNPLQCSCLENSMDRGAWWATVHGL